MLVAVGLSARMKKPAEQEKYSDYLKFSHKLHVKDQGIGCENCHANATKSRSSSDALIGSHESCKSCHEEPLKNNCLMCHTQESNITPVSHPQQELIFSHEHHATDQKIECQLCHASIDTTSSSAEMPVPSMTTCVSCHEEKQASKNCESCHRNFVSLVPDDHRSGNFKKDHRMVTRLGMIKVSCSSCHGESFCQDCHTGTELQGFGFTNDLMTEPNPRSSTDDSPGQQRLQEVHSLNYRFTHGIEAKSKAIDCFNCHEQQTFCTPCHKAGGDITQQRFKPASHNVAGFTTLGKGSGGGLHAEEARRDLETCASCHEAQGNDPLCAKCHF